MRAKESTTKRLDLSPEVVSRAKLAYARRAGKSYEEDKDLEEVYFRDVLDLAIQEFLPTITEGLTKAGFKKRDTKYRQRPVSIETWKKLDAVSSEHDVPKVQLVRAALELLAQMGDEDA